MKATKIYLVLLVFIFSNNVFAQYRFQHIIGGNDHDRAQTIFNTYDGGFIVNGASFSFGAGNVDATLMKTDNQGQLIWSKAYGTITYDNSEYAIEASDHSIFCCGRSNLQPGFPSSAIMFKTDTSGNIIWSKSFGGSGNDDLVEVIETSDHGFAAVGRCQSNSSGASDVFLIKINNNGDTIFTRSYGSTKDEEGLSVIQLPDNGFAITGRQFNFPNGIAEADGLFLRTDALGNLLWTKLYGDSLWDELSAVRITYNSGFILTGSTTSYGSGDFDIWLMKTDSSGDSEWSKIFGGRKTDAAYDIHVNYDQSYVMSGYTESLGYGHFFGDDSSNIFLLKTDSAGDVQWMETYGDGLQDEGFRSSPANDGGYIIPGFTTNYIFTDSTQMLFIKTDSMGFTGCHEERAQPADSFITMPYQYIIFNQLSGIFFGSISLSVTPFTPANDNACVFSSAGIEIKKDEYLIYPNPFVNEIRISLKDNSATRYYITDLCGKKLIEDYISDAETEINTGFLQTGIYILSIEDVNASTKNKLIIKE
jgi:hypothetical protein